MKISKLFIFAIMLPFLLLLAACDSSLPTFPGNVIINFGEPTASLNSILTANFDSNEPATFQWFREKTRIPGATGRTHRAVETGEYTVRVAIQGYKDKMSTPIEVVEGNAGGGSGGGGGRGNMVLRIATVVPGTDPTSFRVNWIGPPAVEYQWYRDGNPVVGPSGTNPVVFPRMVGVYHVVVTDVDGGITRSPPMNVTWVPVPFVEGTVIISTDGSSLSLTGNPEVFSGGNLVSTEVSRRVLRADLVPSQNPLNPGAPATPINPATDWQWYRDGVELSGENGATLNTSTYGPGVYTVSAKPSGFTPRTSNNAVTVTSVVTFNSNGGTAVPPQNVVRGDKAVRPSATRTPSGPDYNRLRGWYTDNGTFLNEFDFNTAINDSRELFADWGWREGDEGPGGGIVYVRSPGPISMADPVNPPYHYLESWPSSISSVFWASPAYRPPNPWLDITPATGTAPGTGRKNTTDILALDPGPNAASNARAFDVISGIPGWFLPSIAELQQLAASPVLGGFIPGAYWSSSQAGDDRATAMVIFPAPGTPFDDLKNQRYNVRPIRAF